MLLNGFEGRKHHLAIVLYSIFGVASSSPTLLRRRRRMQSNSPGRAVYLSAAKDKSITRRVMVRSDSHDAISFLTEPKYHAFQLF
ncbi:hypothetical protein PTI98_000609 [Pleurotus ostreatus]|nr:hypothetical protein PTI98_000609 [Pleurotus ostreatus]